MNAKAYVIVVARRAEQGEARDARGKQQLGMAAGDQQQQIRKLHVVGQARGQRMGGEVIGEDLTNEERWQDSVTYQFTLPSKVT